jgi:hypothetical protein
VTVRRVLLGLLLAGACERQRTPDPKPPPRRDAAVPVTCELADDGVELGQYLDLKFHGKTFAHVFGRVQHVEMHVTEHGATATAISEIATLTGELAHDAVQVRPRKDELVDGWLAIRGAALGGKTMDPVELVFRPDSIVVLAHPPTLRVACKDLTLAAAPERKEHGKEAFLVRGKTSPIAHAPHGEVFAQLVTPPASRRSDFPDPAPTVEVLAARDGWTQVVITGGDADVYGWIPSDALDGPVSWANLTGAFGSMEGKPKLQSCPMAMPIYVRDGETVARVGTTIAGAKLRVTATTADSLVIDLGVEPDLGTALAGGEEAPHLEPFVHRTDAAGCTPVKTK